MTQDTAHTPLDERALEAATDRLLNIRRQDIENGSLMRFREVAAEIIRAYLQTAAADVSGLVDGLESAEAYFPAKGRVAGIPICQKAASTLQTLAASNAALEAENERLRVALKQTEYLMTKDSFSAAERLSEGLAHVRQARATLSAPKGG